MSSNLVSSRSVGFFALQNRWTCASDTRQVAWGNLLCALYGDPCTPNPVETDITSAELELEYLQTLFYVSPPEPRQGLGSCAHLGEASASPPSATTGKVHLLPVLAPPGVGKAPADTRALAP